MNLDVYSIMPYKRSYKSKYTRGVRQRRGMKYSTYKAPRYGGTRSGRKPAKTTYRSNFVVGSVKPIWITKVFQAENLSVGATASTGEGYYLKFNIQDFPGWTNYAALYENFYLKKVLVKICPLYTANLMPNSAAPAGGSTMYFNQDVHSTIDYLNTGEPSSAVNLMNDPCYKRTKMNRDHVRTIYPKLVVDIDDTAGTTNTVKNYWLSTNSGANDNYNGLRIWFDAVSNNALTNPIEYNVYVTYTVGFKGMNL